MKTGSEKILELIHIYKLMIGKYLYCYTKIIDKLRFGQLRFHKNILLQPERPQIDRGTVINSLNKGIKGFVVSSEPTRIVLL